MVNCKKRGGGGGGDHSRVCMVYVCVDRVGGKVEGKVEGKIR